MIKTIGIVIIGLALFYYFQNKESTEQITKPKIAQIKKQTKSKVTALKAFVASENKTHQDKINECKTDKCKNQTFEKKMKEAYQVAQNKNIDEMSNTELLAVMVNPFLGTKDFNNVDFDRLKKIAQKILDFDDTIYAAHKAKLISDFMPFIMGERENLGDFFETLDQMEKFDIEGHDPELYDARALAILKSKKPELLLGYGNKLLGEKPLSGMGHYFKAMYYSDKKNKEKIRSELMAALEREPNNSKYQSALEGLNKGREKIFTFSLSFDIQDF